MTAQRVVFTGLTGSSGDSLWVTDGTSAGTQNITPSSAQTIWDPVFLGSAGNDVVFQGDSLAVSGSGITGSLQQMYVSDGTAAGTVAVGSVSYTGGLVSFGSEAIFNGYDANGNTGLWATDGTVSGTRFVTAATSVDVGGANIAGVGAALNATQAMFADPSGSLWITDGTAAGTHAVSFGGQGVGGMWSFNGKVLFDAQPTGALGSDLFISDGTSAGTQQLFGTNPGAAPVALSPFTVVQVSPTMAITFGDDIWRTDGTTAGTVKVPFSPSALLSEAAALGQTGKAIFTDGAKIYETDGSTVTPIATVASASDMITFNNDVWFMAANASGQYVQWVTDGTAAGTKPVTATGLLDVHVTSTEAPYAATLGAGGAPATSAFTITDTTTGSTTTSNGTAYSGPVAGLTTEFISVTSDSLAITATTPNTFIHTGSGNDAIDVSKVNGTNVLDGGTGSNFLTGGSGSDTFFVDDRVATADIWSTVNHFHSGDAATIWGVTPSDFALSWVDGQGATGYTGLTLHATAAGVPTASLTLAGFTSGDLTNGKLDVTYGTTAASGGVPASTYMYVKAN